MQHNEKLYEYPIFLKCLSDNAPYDRKIFRQSIKLLQRIVDRLDSNQPIQELLIDYYGRSLGYDDHIRQQLLFLINSLDNIMELQDENQPAIMKIATFLEDLNKKENQK